MKKTFSLLLLSATTLLASAATPLRPDSVLIDEPYLQNLVDDGITVMYQTRRQAHTWVEYGTDTLQLRQARQLIGGQEVVHDVEHKVRLRGLEAGQTYYYRVCTQEILLSEAYKKQYGEVSRTRFFRFRLPKADVQDFTALFFGDLHMKPEAMAAIKRVTDTIPHDFIVFNGDCLPEPRDRDHAISMVHTLTNMFDAAEVPTVFLRGNHEIRNAYSSGMPSLFDTPTGETYGTMRWGDTHLLMLDVGEDKVDETPVYGGLNDFTQFRKDQVEYIRQVLKSKDFKKAKRHILVHHIPLFSDLDEGQFEIVKKTVRDLWQPELAKAKFDLAICAHYHRINWFERGEKGNTYPVVTGGGNSVKDEPWQNRATVTVLRKQGKNLSVRLIDCNGQVVYDKKL